MTVTGKNPKQNISLKKIIFSNLTLSCCCKFMRKLRNISCFFSPPIFRPFCPQQLQNKYFVKKCFPIFNLYAAVILYKKSEKLNAPICYGTQKSHCGPPYLQNRHYTIFPQKIIWVNFKPL